ncbi:SAM-dependent methyltransferase, partial [Burkholderia pseudomallei]|nr:SAM-dependent methyltransferase [Burkholderia pseudomallei]
MKTPAIEIERVPGGAHGAATEPSAWVRRWSHLVPAGGAV